MITLILVVVGSFLWIVVSTAYFKIHPFLALLVAAVAAGIGLGFAPTDTMVLVGKGFGGILSSIGVVIVLGSLLGIMLEQSGATHTLANTLMLGIGKRFPVFSLSLIGTVVGIPVFCDAGFILLSRLVERIAVSSRATTTSLSIGLAAGLYSTHTLVPPTPGPIAAAGNLGATGYLGFVILAGILMVLIILPVTVFLSKRLTLKLAENMPEMGGDSVETQNNPSIFRALTPIVLPLFLISIGTIASMLEIENDLWLFLGNPIIALLISVMVAYFLLRTPSMAAFSAQVGKAVEQAGPVLIITGAGGAYGSILSNSTMQTLLQGWLSAQEQTGWLLLLIAFVIAAVLKSAQGSSTAAIVITSALISSVIPESLYQQPVFIILMILSIGGGGMTFSHTNDSFFWVVSQLSGIKVKDALRSYSIVTAAQGVSVLAVVLLVYFSWQFFL